MALQILTLPIRLEPSADDVVALDATIRCFAAACRFVVAETPDLMINEGRLREACYRPVRERFGLSSNLAQQAIARVSANRKAARTSGSRVAAYAEGAVLYDERTFTIKGGADTGDISAGLTLVGGRRRIPIQANGWVRSQLARHAGVRRIRACQLVRRRSKGANRYFIHVQVEVACAEEYTPLDFQGVEKGRRDIAHTSTGRTWSGTHRKTVRDRYHRVRRALQAKASKGTRSSRRRCRQVLHRLSGKERRFHRCENHAIAKVIVEDARSALAGIALEDLSGIRNRTDVPRAMRRDHHGWSFHQLDAFVAYKARLEGVPLLFVQPRYTSTTCSRCGHIGQRTAKLFTCGNCHHRDDADRNAADNLRLLGLSVTQAGGPWCRLPQVVP